MSSKSDSMKSAQQSASNVTNLDEVRQARAQAKQTIDAHDDMLANSHDGMLADTLDDSSVNTADDRHGNRRFDAEKVARLKAQIASGEYKIDPASIAQKFIEHDRNQ